MHMDIDGVSIHIAPTTDNTVWLVATSTDYTVSINMTPEQAMYVGALLDVLGQFTKKQKEIEQHGNF